MVLQGRISRDERRRLLQAGYGFLCHCCACALQGDQLEEDDRLRYEAWQLSQLSLGCHAEMDSTQLSLLIEKVNYTKRDICYYLQGTVSRDFFTLPLSSKQLLLVPIDICTWKGFRFYKKLHGPHVCTRESRHPIGSGVAQLRHWGLLYKFYRACRQFKDNHSWSRLCPRWNTL
jgi:hypothetical protein